jgi:hypothetical protein
MFAWILKKKATYRIKQSAEVYVPFSFIVHMKTFFYLFLQMIESRGLLRVDKNHRYL